MSPDTEEKWTRFTRSMMAVLAGSIVLVAAVIAALATSRVLAASRDALERKADDVARFASRAAFIPVSLEAPSLLERSVSAVLEDPDLVYLEVEDAAGRPIFARELRPRPGPGELIEAAHPVRGPEEAAQPLGTTRVGVSLRRARREALRAVAAIVGTSLLLLALALAAGLTLISGMTQRLRALVGEARLAKKLQEANAELEAFSYSVSHDLRAPLRHIDGYVRLLQKRGAGTLDERSLGYVETLLRESKRMGALIDDLLSFSRTSRAQLRKAPVALGALAEEVARDLGQDAQGRAVE